jgi:class 3 adenylate cyclase
VKPIAIRYAPASDGARIAFADIGAGVPLVFLGPLFVLGPGAGPMLSWFQRLVDALTERFRLVYIQPRGTGSSQRRVGLSLEERSLDISAVMDALELERAAVMAMLQSTPAAARFTARNAERVSHLVLAAPYARGTDLYGPGAAAQSFVGSIMEFDQRTAAETVARSLGWDEDDIRLYRETFDQLCTPSEYQALREILVQDDAAEDLASVTCPTLVWASTQLDVELDHARQVAAIVPDAAFIVADALQASPAVADALAEMLGGPQARRDEDAAGGAFRTILFTDVEASTDLTDRFGDAKARDLLREHERLTREALAQHGGTEIKTMGDGFMASFTSVSGALDAAIAMQRALTDHFAPTETPIRIRVGINAGEPIEEDDDLYGTAVIQAARVMGLADGGQILVTDTVRNLVAGKEYRFHDHGTHDLKGFEEPARLFEVAW